MAMDCFNLLSERIGPGEGCFIPFLLATNDSLFGGSIGRLCGGQAHKGEAAAGTAGLGTPVLAGLSPRPLLDLPRERTSFCAKNERLMRI